MKTKQERKDEVWEEYFNDLKIAVKKRDNKVKEIDEEKWYINY